MLDTSGDGNVDYKELHIAIKGVAPKKCKLTKIGSSKSAKLLETKLSLKEEKEETAAAEQRASDAAKSGERSQ